MTDAPSTDSRQIRILKLYGITLFIWTLLALGSFAGSYLSLRDMGRPVEWKYLLGSTVASFGIYALMTPGVLWLSWRFPVERKNWIRHGLIHVAAALTFTCIHVLLRPMVFKLRPSDVQRAHMTWVMFRETFLFFVFDNTMNTYLPIAVLGHLIFYYRRWRERELRSSQLEAQLARAQLSMLKMQLQPHFLFNTLHAVSALIRDNPEAAEEMLIRLSDLLRLTLDHEAAQEIPLKAEVDFIRRYLEIEQTRFADRLQVHWDIAPAVLDALVPNMILQPLVENALRHGIGQRAEGGSVEIRAWRDINDLFISVVDDGPGLGRNRSMAEGIGLSNTRSRLRQLYGGAQSFTLTDLPEGGARATARIPLQLKSSGESGDHWFEVPLSKLAPSQLGTRK